MSFSQKYKENGFKYIHIGLLQICIKPLSKERLNTSIFVVLLDARLKNFHDSRLSSVESSLCSGPMSFNYFLNFTIFLNDQNIIQFLDLQIKTHNYKMLSWSIHPALLFKVHYKYMQSKFTIEHRFQSGKWETILLQTDLTRSNIIISRPI